MSEGKGKTVAVRVYPPCVLCGGPLGRAIGEGDHELRCEACGFEQGVRVSIVDLRDGPFEVQTRYFSKVREEEE